MISEEKIKTAISLLAKAAKPQKIFLFGSYARNEADEHSDLDFLIIERNLKKRRRKTVLLHDVIRPMRIPVDILLVSESTFNEWSDVVGTIIHKAKTEGRLCYDVSETS